MNTMMKSLLVGLCLATGAPALAAPPEAPVSTGKQRARPCQRPGSNERYIWPQGTLLWGTRRKVEKEEMSSVLVSVDLGSLQLAGERGAGLKVERGHLMIGSGGGWSGGGVSPASDELVGAVLQGAASDGRPVEVAICAAEPQAGDAETMLYRIETQNEETGEWENPCAGTAQVPAPRAVAVGGVWNARGEHQEEPGRFTFACEGGAIAKCIIGWGYKPWKTQGGRSLADLHQACTRMARADYCGDGRSHTRGGTLVDVYDSAGVAERQVGAVEGWDPAQASFEAAWTTEGAYCMAHTRTGRELKVIKEECPGRWMDEVQDLGKGDRCVMRRRGASKDQVLVRNWSYGKEQPVAKMAAGR